MNSPLAKKGVVDWDFDLKLFTRETPPPIGTMSSSRYTRRRQVKIRGGT